MATRRYETDEITILWDSSRCVHVAACVRALPEVFDPRERPWIRPEHASTDELIDAVERCPTGALRYERADGEPEPAEGETTIIAVMNGPLVLRGLLHVVTPGGETIARESRLALCRCGQTGNAPFCDGSHYTSNFHSRAAAPNALREEAASPEAVAPLQEQQFPEGTA